MMQGLENIQMCLPPTHPYFLGSCRSQTSCGSSLLSLSVTLYLTKPQLHPALFASRWRIKSNCGKVFVSFKKPKKGKASCMGALCSLAHVHTELQLNLFVGEESVGWLVKLSSAGRAMKEEERREKVKGAM